MEWCFYNFLPLARIEYIYILWAPDEAVRRLDYNYHRPHSWLDWPTPAAYAAYAAKCPSRSRTYEAATLPFLQEERLHEKFQTCPEGVSKVDVTPIVG